MRDSDGGGWSATTRFDQFSHAQLIDMVNGSAPASVSSIADTLNSASTQIQSLADDLNTHITHLQWDGAAGDSFRGWARQVVQAMDELSTFHNNAGVAMQMAGGTLTSVKAAMPPVPTTDVATVDAFVRQASTTITPQPVVMNGRVLPPVGVTPPLLPGQISQSDAYAAQGRVDAAHQEAIVQMEKLGGAYNGATQTMDVNQEPKFPPTPDALMPPNGYGKHGSSYVGGPGGGSGGAGGLGSVGGGGGGIGSGHHGAGGTVSGAPSGGGTIHEPSAPGQSGGTATLQGAHPPVAGPPQVRGPGAGSPPPGTPPGTPPGSGSGHGPGGPVIVPPGGSGELTPPSGRGPGAVRGGRGGRQGPSAGEPFGESAGHGGVVGGRGGFGGAGRGGRFGGGVGAGPGSEAIGAGPEGSSSAHVGTPAGEGASREGISGAGAGEAGGGGMMGGGGMGGLGGASGRGRSRGGRPAYLSEDEDTWSAPTNTNPAVIE